MIQLVSIAAKEVIKKTIDTTIELAKKRSV